MIQIRQYIVLLIALSACVLYLIHIENNYVDTTSQASLFLYNFVDENITEGMITMINSDQEDDGHDDDGHDDDANEKEEEEEGEENDRYITYHNDDDDNDIIMIDQEDDGHDDDRISSSEEEEKENNDNERSDYEIDQLHEIQSGKVTPLTIDQLMNFNCHEPIGAVQGNQDTKKKFPSKIINVGFPKTGSTSIHRLFSNSGKLLKNEYKHASHWRCGKVNGKTRHCGVCMNEAMKEGRPLLSSCGDYKVYAQMDYETTRVKCFFPQMSSLNEIYDEVPDAVFLLSFRNLTSWYASLEHQSNMRKRLAKRCDVPGLPRGIGWDDDDLERWVCGHVQNIRKFVFDHPSITLIEFSLEDKDVGEYLASILPGLDPQFWSKNNVGSYKKKSGRRKLQRYSRFA